MIELEIREFLLNYLEANLDDISDCWYQGFEDAPNINFNKIAKDIIENLKYERI